MANNFSTFIAPLAKDGTQTTEANRRELGLKMWSGELLNAYDDKVITDGKVRQIVIGDGISAQFPATSKVSGGFHSPGTDVTTQNCEQSERIISLDDVLYASLFWPMQYDLVGHIDVRQEYARASANVLAKAKDTMVFAEIIKAARSSAILTDHDGGSQIVSDSFKNDGGTAGASDDNEVALAIFNSLFVAAELFESCIGDLGVLEPQLLKSGQASKMRQSRIADSGAGEGQIREVGQAVQMLQSGTADLVLGDGQMPELS